MSNYELNRHRRGDKVKWAFTTVAFVLVFVFIAGLCLQLFGKGKVKPSEWFTKAECVHVSGENGLCSKCGAELTVNADDVNAENKDSGK